MNKLGLELVNTNYSVFIYYKIKILIALYIDNILVTNPYKVKI